MLKRIILSILGIVAISVPLDAAAQTPVQWRYDFDTTGTARATYPGTVRTQGATVSDNGNPTLPGGLNFPNDSVSWASQVDNYTLTGTRTVAQIGRYINLTDGQVGPASGPMMPTPGSASYGLSITGYRPDWQTSGITGEMNGMSIVLRQASSDSAAMLSNIGIRDGFAATIESITSAMDVNAVATKAVRTQLGVANPRDNAYYGLLLSAEVGTNLTAGLRIYSSAPGATWANYVEVADVTGALVFHIRSSDGAAFTKTVAPQSQYGGNLGAPGLEYDTYYGKLMRLTPLPYVTLVSVRPCNASNIGTVARVSDASAAITTFNQIVSAGGGANTAMLTCDGANWRALSS